MISSISIDKFGDIDSLQLQLKKFHKVGVSSGGDSLLTMLLVLSQSFLPGHAYDWQNVTRPGESSFGTGRLAVRGKMFDVFSKYWSKERGNNIRLRKRY